MAEGQVMKSCIVPCKPILEWQREHIKEMKELQRSVKDKTSQSLFFWVLGGIVFFVVVVIGGAQWGIVHNMALISSDTKVVSVAITELNNKVNYHIASDDLRHDRNVSRIEKLREDMYNERKHKYNKNGGEQWP